MGLAVCLTDAGLCSSVKLRDTLTQTGLRVCQAERTRLSLFPGLTGTFNIMLHPVALKLYQMNETTSYLLTSSHISNLKMFSISNLLAR